MKTRSFIIAARILSALFTPLYLPVVGMLVLFLFSYLSLLPVAYKMTVLGVVVVFTVLLPLFLIRVYRRYNGWTPIQLGQRERRAVPYVIAIGCYLLCNYVMLQLHIPYIIRAVITMALLVQIVCALLNSWWKISTHTAGIGGVAGALLVFADMFGFNPIWWFCVVIVIAGLLGTCRMILRQHSLGQVVGGFFVGFACAIVGAFL